MSVNGYAKLTPGTPISWKASGGDHVLTLTSLANGSARQGDKGDLGQYFARRWAVLVSIQLGSAGVNGDSVEVFWAASPTATAGTDNPGSCTGADAAFGTPAEYKLQLIPIGLLAVSNNAGTNVQTEVFELTPPCRYGMPVIVNSSGVSFGATAGNFEVRLIPIEEPVTTTVTG